MTNVNCVLIQFTKCYREYGFRFGDILHPEKIHQADEVYMGVNSVRMMSGMPLSTNIREIYTEFEGYASSPVDFLAFFG